EDWLRLSVLSKDISADAKSPTVRHHHAFHRLLRDQVPVHAGWTLPPAFSGRWLNHASRSSSERGVLPLASGRNGGFQLLQASSFRRSSRMKDRSKHTDR